MFTYRPQSSQFTFYVQSTSFNAVSIVPKSTVPQSTVPKVDIIPVVAGVGAAALVILIIVIIVILHRRGVLKCKGKLNLSIDVSVKEHVYLNSSGHISCMLSWHTMALY